MNTKLAIVAALLAVAVAAVAGTTEAYAQANQNTQGGSGQTTGSNFNAQVAGDNSLGFAGSLTGTCTTGTCGSVTISGFNSGP